MREAITKQRLQELMKALAQSAPRSGDFRVYLVGGATAVFVGWRKSTIDVDLYSDQEALFRTIQEIKERLNINIEFARPEHFVPPLQESDDRHVHIVTTGPVTFCHYDPYAQLLAKVVRGFERDLQDSREFITHKMVEIEPFRSLVTGLSDAVYAKYPSLSRRGVETAVEAFLSTLPHD